MRKPEHRATYDEIRGDSLNDPDPDVEHLGKIPEGEMPGLGHSAMISDKLRDRGYDSMVRWDNWPTDDAAAAGFLSRSASNVNRADCGQAARRTVADWLTGCTAPCPKTRLFIRCSAASTILSSDIRVGINAQGYSGGACRPDTHFVATALHPLTAAHELAHAATVYAMQKNPVFVDHIGRIMGHIEDSPQYRAYVQALKDADDLPGLARATRFMDNPFEYVADYMANPQVRELVNSIPAAAKLLRDLKIAPAKKSLLRAAAISDRQVAAHRK